MPLLADRTTLLLVGTVVVARLTSSTRSDIAQHMYHLHIQYHYADRSAARYFIWRYCGAPVLVALRQLYQ